MDIEPPDDGSMGGGDESEQGTRQKMHFCQRSVKKKSYMDLRKETKLVSYPCSNIHLFSLYVFFCVLRVHTGSQNDLGEAKDILAIGRIRVCSKEGRKEVRKDKHCQDRNKVH